MSFEKVPCGGRTCNHQCYAIGEWAEPILCSEGTPTFLLTHHGINWDLALKIAHLTGTGIVLVLVLVLSLDPASLRSKTSGGRWILWTMYASARRAGHPSPVSSCRRDFWRDHTVFRSLDAWKTRAHIYYIIILSQIYFEWDKDDKRDLWWFMSGQDMNRKGEIFIALLFKLGRRKVYCGWKKRTEKRWGKL